MDKNSPTHKGENTSNCRAALSLSLSSFLVSFVFSLSYFLLSKKGISAAPGNPQSLPPPPHGHLRRLEIDAIFRRLGVVVCSTCPVSWRRISVVLAGKIFD